MAEVVVAVVVATEVVVDVEDLVVVETVPLDEVEPEVVPDEVVEVLFKQDVSATRKHQDYTRTPNHGNHVLLDWMVKGADWARAPVLSRRLRPIWVSGVVRFGHLSHRREAHGETH